MPLVGRQGSRVSMRVARGSASLLPSHGRGIWPRDVLKKVSRGLSRVEAQEPQPRRAAAAAAATHWGLARACARGRAHTLTRARALVRPQPQPRRAEGRAPAGARQEPEPRNTGTCGAEPRRGRLGGEAPPPRPARAHRLPRARAPALTPTALRRPACTRAPLPQDSKNNAPGAGPGPAEERAGERGRGWVGLGGEREAREVH